MKNKKLGKKEIYDFLKKEGNEEADKLIDKMVFDSINPSWYKSKSGIEVIDIIESFDLDYYQATAIKYILRAGKKHKETEIEDYEKALWFIDRKIKRLEK